MRREPLPPAWRPAAARPRWRSAPPAAGSLGFPGWWAGSLAAHVLLALLLYFWPDPRKPPEPLPPPTFDIVFEGGQAERPQEEPPEGAPTEPEPPAMAEPPPAPDAPPVPAQPPVPPSQTALPEPPAPPVPPPPMPLPPVQQALPLPLPVPPLPVPPPPEVRQAMPLPPAVLPPLDPTPMPPIAGAVELFVPPTDLRLPDRLAETLPPPPPPPPPLPQTAPPAPQRQAAAPQARPNLPGIWMPGAPQFGRTPTPPAGRPQGRGLDLTVDPRLTEGRPMRDPSVRVTGAQVGSDWRAAFRRWLDQNIHYPQQAVQRGEDGVVRVRVTAAADGTVRNVQLVGPSTSPSLNFGTSYPFNGARLPAFPPGSEPVVTIDLTVNYVLIRR